MLFACCVFCFCTVTMFHINFNFFYILISEEAKVLTNTRAQPSGNRRLFYCPKKGEGRTVYDI